MSRARERADGILGDYKHLQVRKAIVIKEDDSETKNNKINKYLRTNRMSI